MYYQVASKLVVTGAASYTQAVSLAGANAVYCTIQTIGTNTPTAGSAQLQIGNDLENWVDSGGTVNINSVGGTTLSGTALAAQYARLKFATQASGGGTLIIAADVNTASL